ncbi:hypothetical protein COTS27_01570 [Spirochaetota bacterium]|nr:hypothetical protein COTS27_01570 [Spirochaetota bacterium]
MKKQELKKHIDRASDILVQVAKHHRASLPSIKKEAEIMKNELSKVSALEKVFRKRAQDVLTVLKNRKNDAKK